MGLIHTPKEWIPLRDSFKTPLDSHRQMYTFRPYLQIIQLEIHMHYYRHVLVEMRQNQ